MELRVDRLLEHLKENRVAVLQAIDRDPMLLKRTIDGITLANAMKELFTPQETHQLFAKGIVYRRENWELVSLPLIKIYNLGEREVTAHSLASLSEQNHLRVLTKMDGTMLQRFQANGRVYFTTRGVIEGVRPLTEADDGENANFDYVGSARQMARELYPQLLQTPSEWDGLSFVFEFIHPETRVITDYGGMRDLVLIAVFDTREFRYYPYPEMERFADRWSLRVVQPMPTVGKTLTEQIDSLLGLIAGTDHEGGVLVFEDPHRVVYRAKVKGPDYLRLLKLAVRCNYSSTVEMLEAQPNLLSWEEFAEILRNMGSEKVPEELLGMYREHYDAYCQYLQDCATIVEHIKRVCETYRVRLTETDPRQRRKELAGLIAHERLKGLIFTAYDGKLDVKAVTKIFTTAREVQEVLERI